MKSENSVEAWQQNDLTSVVDNTHNKMFLEEMIVQMNKPRYQEMLKFRKSLPAYKMKNEILDATRSHQVVVLSGETGCGKTTQVPQLLLEQEVLAGRGAQCRIVCTQPRRISAISVAQRVAQERGEKLGNTVGYQIRLESLCPRLHASITYCTTGIVLQWLQSDKLLSTCSHLVIDEVHERDINTDFLICVTKLILSKRPDLKLVLMSATLDAEEFSRYYQGAPMIHVQGFTFPVIEHYLEDALHVTKFIYNEERKSKSWRRNDFDNGCEKVKNEFLNEITPWVRSKRDAGGLSLHVATEMLKPDSEKIHISLIVSLLQHICITQPDGAVLVFVPGWKEIADLYDVIRQDRLISCYQTVVYPLHSLMPTTSQRNIFERPPKGVRKIVLATSIAETSITIDDIVYVIDSGYIKLRNFNKTTNLASLDTEFVAKANAKQRCGRAGRVQAGVCYHLFSRKRAELLDDYKLPEVLRTRVEEVILQIKILRLGRVKPFLSQLMQPPDEEVIDLSIKLLESINALDEDENLTPLGFHLARLPVDPLTGRMLIMAAIFSCLDPILTVASVFAFKEPFVIPLGKEHQVDEVRRRLSCGTNSDHLMYVRTYDEWRESGYSDTFCRSNFIVPSVMKQLRDMRGQFFKLLQSSKFISEDVENGLSEVVNYNSGNIYLVRGVLVAGLYPNVARIILPKKLNKRPFKMSTADQSKVSFHPKCIIRPGVKLQYSWIVYREKMKLNEVMLFDASNVSNYPLLLFGRKVEYKPEESVIDVDGFVKVSVKQNVAELIGRLRRQLDLLLECKISHPGMTMWQDKTHNASEIQLLLAIVDLLESEKP